MTVITEAYCGNFKKCNIYLYQVSSCMKKTSAQQQVQQLCYADLNKELGGEVSQFAKMETSGWTEKWKMIKRLKFLTGALSNSNNFHMKPCPQAIVSDS